MRCRRVENQIIADGKRAQPFAKLRSWPTEERMPGQQFARLFQRVEKVVGGDRIQIENVENNSLDVGVGVRRLAISIHCPPRSRRCNFFRRFSMVVLPSTVSPRRICSRPLAIFSRNSAAFERMNSSCARSMPRLWATTSAAER